MSFVKNQTVLITGGSGSFGNAMVENLLSTDVKRIIVFSRDEYKQMQMKQKFPEDFKMHYYIGDVRDEERLVKALQGVDVVIHAAAIKQVDTCEYNPEEAVKTNVFGAMGLINACLRVGTVKKVIALSSDKAVNPINLYGATKLVAEKLFIAANALSARKTLFSVVRYGNVLSSRGSVIEVFKRQIENKEVLTITDPKMTRFWWTLEQASMFVDRVINFMKGGEIFIPKLKSASIEQLIKALGDDFKFEVVGIRPGEKMHEVLVAPDESFNTNDIEWAYVVYPSLVYFKIEKQGNELEEALDYTSKYCTFELQKLKKLINSI